MRNWSSYLGCSTSENWVKFGEHCNKIQEDDLMKKGLKDKILKPIIITINPGDSSAYEYDDDDELF